jgi:hypothetical protein
MDKVNGSEGFRGIWFQLDVTFPYGDKYSGGLGTFSANHTPMAVYAPQVQKTFFTYGGAGGETLDHLHIMVASYHHQTGQVERPVVLHVKEGVDDPHDNGSLNLDEQGHIWVFVSGRGKKRPGYIYRSVSPWCIHSFERVSEAEITFPQPWWLAGSGFLLLLTQYAKGTSHGPCRELYWKTSTDGRVWSEVNLLASFGGHYQVSGQCGSKIATFFNWHPESQVDWRTNVYYAQTLDGGQTWTDVQGHVLPVPLRSPDNPALVRDFLCEKKLMYTCDLNFDAEGNPILLFITSRSAHPGPKGDPREWTVLHWDGARWREHVITTSDHNYDMGSLYVEGKTWRVIGPTELGPQPYGTGGEMALWESEDLGHSWRRKCLLTQNSRFNHSYARRPLYATDPFYAFWLDGDPHRRSESHVFFSDSQGEQVCRLPYDMSCEGLVPQRLACGPVLEVSE